jgi:DNA/RNA-binding domain of Phe-tRNA-synthetase-like protein
MIEIEIEDAVRAAAPDLYEIVVEADVENGPTDDALWAEITAAAKNLRDNMPMDMVNKQSAILATRKAYKALGKEPNRYRPSAEALCRRCVKGLELYRTLTVVDLINLISILTGHSIGGFDRDKIEGGRLCLGVGREGELYEAIGRGQLNIACLPVFRDVVGGVGTPTSDNDRTKLSPDTHHLLMTINMYSGRDGADEMEALTRRLLEQYAAGRNITFTHYGNS